MQWVRDYAPEAGRYPLYRRALIITVVGNILLVVSKGIIARLSGSVGLYADMANSGADVLYSLLMVLGLWVAQRPPDLSHPQGHSRFEPLVGLAVALSMALAGYEAARAAVQRSLVGGLAVEPGLPTVILLASAALKACMYLAIVRIARVLASPALTATARDNLSDVLTSIAAFVGVWGSRLVHPLLDAGAGLLVASWIFRAAWSALSENLNYLTGAGATPALREHIAQAAMEVSGVAGVHQVITEYAGPQLVADLHIEVNKGLSLIEAHEIGDAVRACLEELTQVDRAYVHVEPQDDPAPD
jgi:cation diffusion facilitator family transporter